jgi:spore germination protein GerM
MRNKLPITICAFLVIVLTVLIGIRFFNNEDNWICQNGEWIKHGNPSAPKPTELCGGNNQQAADIIVSTPQPNATVNSPIIIEGKARGNWYFEASFPIHLLDDQGNELATTIAQAQSDWMTTDFVSFKAGLKYQSDKEINGTLVFQNDNPSGLPEKQKEVKIPVILSPSQLVKVKVYFNNNKLDPEISCNKVFSTEREIPETLAIARNAIEELLKGPTEKEKSEGYFTSINESVEIQKISIVDGEAKIDFNEKLDYQVGGSCRVSAIRSQITETLKQFSTVKNVIISINGRTEDILQP